MHWHLIEAAVTRRSGNRRFLCQHFSSVGSLPLVMEKGRIQGGGVISFSDFFLIGREKIVSQYEVR